MAMTPSRKAHGGAVANLNFRHFSAGCPVMAQMDGKSLATSCDCQMVTRSGGLINVQPEELVEAAIEARLACDLADRKQDPWNVRLAARGPMRDGQGLTGQSEDDLLVGDQARQANAADSQAGLFPPSRARPRCLLRSLVRDRLVLAPCLK